MTVPRKSQPTQLPKGAKIYLPDEAARKRAVEERLFEVFRRWGYREVVTPRLRVLRRALAGHRPGAPGADVQDGGPRERAAAGPARRRDAADRPHRRHPDARRAQAAAAGLRDQRVPLRRAARGPLPRVLPGRGGADRPAQSRGRRRDDRDDGRGPPRARARALPDRRRAGRVLPRHPGRPGRRARRGPRAARRRWAARTSRPWSAWSASWPRPRR